MSSPHNPSKNVAPLKIVECYEQFKEAVKSGELSRAYQSLQEMRGYQGGERLANELQYDLKKVENKESFASQKEQDLQQISPIISEEDRAQNILSHIELFETFFHDHFYGEALKHIYAIEQLGDEELAQKLQKKLSAKVPNIQEFLEENQENKKRENGEKEKNKQLQDFYIALKQGRTTYAKNLLPHIPCTQEESLELQDMLERKKIEVQELKRKEKSDTLFLELQSLLGLKDFQAAKRLLTKMQYFATEEEQEMAKSIYEGAVEQDRKDIQEGLYAAILKNLKEKDLIMAEKNLKDFKKIASREQYEQLQGLIETYEIKTKKKSHLLSQKEIERKEKIVKLFDEAKLQLLKKEYAEVQTISQKIALLKERGLAEYLKKQILISKQKEAEEKKTSSRKEWIDKFYAFLRGELSCSKKELFLGTEKIFTPTELQEYMLRFDQYVSRKDFYIALDEHDFELARKIARELPGERNEKARLLLEIREKERAEERKEHEEKVRKLLNSIDILRSEGNHQKLLEKAKELESLGEQKKYQELLQEISQEQSQKNLSILQKQIETLKKQGHFEQALELSKELLALEQKSSYEQVKKSLLLEKERFEKHKRAALFSYISREIDQWNFAAFHVKKSMLTDDQVNRLRKKIQQKKEEQIKEKESQRITQLKEAFTIAKGQSLSALTAIYEKLKILVPAEQLQFFTGEIEEKQKEDQEKKYKDLLHRAQDFLTEGNTDAMKQCAQELVDLGFPDDANKLIAEALKQEQALDLLQRKQRLQEITGIVKESLQLSLYDACFHLFLAERELLLDPRIHEDLDGISPLMEEVLSYYIGAEQFDSAKELLALFELLYPSRSHPLRVILRERERRVLEQFHLVGAEDYVRKQSVLTHYRAWKEAYENGVEDAQHIEAIKTLGEEGLFSAMLSFSQKGRQITKDELQDYIQEQNLELLSKNIEKNFSQWSFEILIPIARHFEEIFHHRSREARVQAGNTLEKNIQSFLEKQNFQEAKNVLFQVNSKKYDPARLRSIAESFVRSERVFIMSQQDRALESFTEALDKRDFALSLQLVSHLPVKHAIEAMGKVLLQNQELLVSPELHSLYSFEAAKELLIKDYKEAWEHFIRFLETHPSLESAQKEEYIKDFLLIGDTFLQQKKADLHLIIEQGDFEQAQRIMEQLELIQHVHEQKHKWMLRKNEVWNSTFSSLKKVLLEQKPEKARNIIKASLEFFSKEERSYFEYLIRQEEIRLKYQSIKDILSLFEQSINKGDLDQATLLREQVQEHWVRDIFTHYIEIISQKKYIQDWKISFAALLQGEQFQEAEKTLMLFREDIELFIESSLLLEEKKKVVFQEEAQRHKNRLTRTLEQGMETQILENIEQFESFCLDAMFLYGDIQYLFVLKSFFLSLVSSSFFEQDRIKIALKDYDFEKVESLLTLLPYSRLQSYYRKKLLLEKTQMNFIDRQKHFEKIYTLLKTGNLHESSIQIKTIQDWYSLEEIDNTYIVLIEKESHAANAEREETLNRIREDMEMHIRYKRLKEARELMGKVSSLLMPGELEDVWLALRKLEEEEEEKKRKDMMRAEKVRQENIKSYEMFVQEALKAYNFEEAAKFIQEIELNQGHEKAAELKELFEKEKALFKKQQEKEQKLHEIQHLLDTFLWKEAETCIQQSAHLYPEEIGEYAQKLLRLQKKGKHKLIDEAIQDCLKKGDFDGAEKLLEKL